MEERETIPGRQYRPRRRKDLTLDEQREIINSYNSKYLPQKEIARQFRVTVQLVRDLLDDEKKKPEKLRERKEREKRTAMQEEAVQQAIRSMQQERKPIESA